MTNQGQNFEGQTPRLNAQAGTFYGSVAKADEAGVFDCDEFLDLVEWLEYDSICTPDECEAGKHYELSKQWWVENQPS